MTLINDLIKNYSLINENTLPIEDFVKKYPYCQTAQLLLLINYKINNSLSYQKQLAKTSACYLNRKALYNIINCDNTQNIFYTKSETEQVITTQDNLRTLPNENIADVTEDKIVIQEDKAIDTKEIIDNFISKEPRIEIKKEFNSDNDLSENSVQDNFDLVSETLAQIYIKQGNNEKAIKTFEKLILKYPEKNSYFASLIENLKKQSNI